MADNNNTSLLDMMRAKYPDMFGIGAKPMPEKLTSEPGDMPLPILASNTKSEKVIKPLAKENFANKENDAINKIKEDEAISGIKKDVDEQDQKDKDDEDTEENPVTDNEKVEGEYSEGDKLGNEAADKELKDESDEDDSDEDDSEDEPKETEETSSAPIKKVEPPPRPLTLQEKFQNAQQQQRQAQDAGDYGRIAAQLSAGLGRQSPEIMKQNMALADSIAAHGSLPMEQLNQDIAFQKQNPDSNYSKHAKDFLVQKFGIKPESLDGLSAEQLEKTFMGPALKTYEANETRNANAAKLQQQIQSREQINKNNILNRNLLDKQHQQNLALQRENIAKDKQDKFEYKQQHDDELTQQKFGKSINGLAASSRSAIGRAVLSNMSADRALDIVKTPGATSQDMSSVASDLNAIISGNSTISGSKHQEYSNLASKFAELQSFWTSNPKAPNIPEVKKHIEDVILRMKHISDEVTNKNLGINKATYSSWMKRHPEDAEEMIKSVIGDQQQNTYSTTSLPKTRKQTINGITYTYTLNPETGEYE